MRPLITLKVQEQLRAAAVSGLATAECSFDLDRTRTQVVVDSTGWTLHETRYSYLENCKDRTIYYWNGESFQPISRFAGSLIKLVPTQWGAPTFEIDGIKMLPTEHVSPYLDAERKVGLIQPRGKIVLDTCGGLGYFAAWCLKGQATKIYSYEKNPEVLWLRSLNPWSPEGDATAVKDERLVLQQADITQQIVTLPDQSMEAVLHDPPRFGIAGELYSQAFYDQLARVLRRKGRLFHYTGAPNKLTTGRDVPNEVANRLRRAGFDTKLEGDGILARKK
jgi:predicted methyltransferase